MPIIELTDSQVKNLADFFELEFVDSVKRDDSIDNINYLVDMCDIYSKLNKAKGE